MTIRAIVLFAAALLFAPSSQPRPRRQSRRSVIAQREGAGGLQGEVRHQQRHLRHRGASRLGAERRRPLLQSGEERLLQRRAVLPRDRRLHGAVRHQRQPGPLRRVARRQYQGRSGQAEQHPRHGQLRHRRPRTRAPPRCSSISATMPGSTARASRPSAKWCPGMDVVDSLYGGYGEGAPRGAAPTRAASRRKATPIWTRPFPSSTTSRRRPSSNNQPGNEKEAFIMANPEDTLILETSKGNVTVEMRPDLAPSHVARIKELARQGFYDGVPFHRVIDGFMAQTGDPTGTGTGGSGQKLDAEFNAEPHTRGAVSMARAQSPDSADSQFFIVLRRRDLPRPQIHGVGPRDRRHGECRQDQSRRAAGEPRQDPVGQDRLRRSGLRCNGRDAHVAAGSSAHAGRACHRRHDRPAGAHQCRSRRPASAIPCPRPPCRSASARSR